MVATVIPFTDPRNRVDSGQGFDGVVRVTYEGYFGTGALVFGGRAVLTAAHLFPNATGSANVFFETSAGSQVIASSRLLLHPDYDAVNGNHDLALVWLSSSAPISADRYNLYRDSDEIGQTMTMVGYGTPGSGDTGILTSFSGTPLRLKASNQFDADIATLKASLGSTMAWMPTAGTQLIADFDNGTSGRDALRQLINLPGLGLGPDEGIISPGDSGGPALLNGRIAGIASYTASLAKGSATPDIDTVTNSSFGEIGFWQRLSNYQQWIDQSLRAEYPNAPAKAADVQKEVAESDSGTRYAYFLLQFSGVRSDAGQLLSVDYATRDGTAIAGSDYLAVSDTLVLYPNENQATIPVEIIGDLIAEPDETFYLDVFNPVGGSFGAGIIQLTAMRTIVNDDGGF